MRCRGRRLSRQLFSEFLHHNLRRFSLTNVTAPDLRARLKLVLNSKEFALLKHEFGPHDLDPFLFYKVKTVAFDNQLIIRMIGQIPVFISRLSNSGQTITTCQIPKQIEKKRGKLITVSLHPPLDGSARQATPFEPTNPDAPPERQEKRPNPSPLRANALSSEAFTLMSAFFAPGEAGLRLGLVEKLE
ncbi:hypothetical protein AVEN_235353-1 [Araneus ventricosus]|uniref:Uncharacterized protein n=1 Tax=Araneus ventricosus TaxID=182803 RepID=A0A4Y2A4T9_ARAVE|nr:hypothetical protein AVEN_235353-1 [Araneus ventricosus]